MQEGTKAFVEMIAIVRAVVAHKEAGLPFLVYLRHPTTGGAFASWGSLGHLTFAEPGALVGFLGPRVFGALNGTEFPRGVQSAENLLDKGVLDSVIPPDDVADLVDRILGLMDPSRISCASRQAPPPAFVQPAVRPDAWHSVTITRREDRPGVRELLAHAATDTVLMSGTGDGRIGAGMVLALTRLSGTPCVVVGHDRSHPNAGAIGPDGLRVARRGMALANELHLPLLTVIDTPGAELSPEAEENALAGEIARCLTDLTGLRVPSVALLMGQGCGGGALALLPATRVVAAQHAWLAPLPPEGASVIVHGSVERAADMANAQRIVATELLSDRLVDVVVPEDPEGQEDPADLCRRLASAAVEQLRAQAVSDREAS